MDNNVNLKKEDKSRVLTFKYGPYGDTNKALIYGDIYEFDSTFYSLDSLQPLTNVLIKIEQNNQRILTDTGGHFILGLDKGTFDLLITKAGYQSLKLTNYTSNPDQISHTKVVLVKGEGLQTFTIPIWIK